MRDSRAVHFATALIVLLLVASTLRPSRLRSLPDFDKAYYPAGQRILTSPSTLYDADVVDFVNLPIVALLFAPFASLDPEPARLAFTLLGELAVLLAAASILLLTRASGWRPAAVLGLFLLNGPLHYSFALGNASHVLLPLLLAIYVDSQARREVRAGVLLALAALVKVPLFVLGGYFVLRRRWRAAGAFGAAVLAVSGLSVLLFGLDLHRVWLERCILPFGRGPLSAYNVQSVDGFLARLMTDGGRYDWTPIPVGAGFLVLRDTLRVVVAGAALLVCARSAAPTRPQVETLELSIVLCLALLVSPISWIHYYAFLLLPLCFVVSGAVAPPPRPWLGILAAGTALVSLPVVSEARAGSPLRLVLLATADSPYFLGGLLLLAALLAARWRAS